MTEGLIFQVRSDGGLSRMMVGAPPSEDRMQELVARFPELIGDSDGDLLLVQREQPIADTLGGSGRWSLDHLFVTKTAVPVLVELKRSVDTRLRREVVGQLLDYAANGVAYWEAGRIAEAFAATCQAQGKIPEEEIRAFVGETRADDFWAQVDANFQAGRIKLVFVADIIPLELARIVEFLNEQMRAAVRAVELRWYAGTDGSTTLAPRVFGETQRAAAQKRGREGLQPISVEEWIEGNVGRFGDEALKGAYAYAEWIETLGGAPVVSKLQGSIMGEFRNSRGEPVYPLHLWEQGAVVSLSFRSLLRRPGLASEAERRRHYEAFAAILGPLSTANLQGGPSFKVSLLADLARRAALAEAGRDFIAAAILDT